MMGILDIVNIALCVVLAILIYKNRHWKYQPVIIVLFIAIVISIVITLIFT